MRKTVLSFILLLVHLCAVAEVRIVHQTVNAMTSPIGISHLNPRFGWAFEADYERGIMQEAYSISIYEANHLDSPVFSKGMTEGDACVDVCIPDLQLAPCTSYCWKVTARLNDGTVVESSSVALRDVPEILGLTFDHITLFEKLPVRDDSVFGRILTVTQLLDKYELHADKIYFDSNDFVSIQKLFSMFEFYLWLN